MGAMCCCITSSVAVIVLPIWGVMLLGHSPSFEIPNKLKTDAGWACFVATGAYVVTGVLSLGKVIKSQQNTRTLHRRSYLNLQEGAERVNEEGGGDDDELGRIHGDRHNTNQFNRYVIDNNNNSNYRNGRSGVAAHTSISTHQNVEMKPLLQDVLENEEQEEESNHLYDESYSFFNSDKIQGLKDKGGHECRKINHDTFEKEKRKIEMDQSQPSCTVKPSGKRRGDEREFTGDDVNSVIIDSSSSDVCSGSSKKSKLSKQSNSKESSHPDEYPSLIEFSPPPSPELPCNNLSHQPNSPFLPPLSKTVHGVWGTDTLRGERNTSITESRRRHNEMLKIMSNQNYLAGRSKCINKIFHTYESQDFRLKLDNYSLSPAAAALMTSSHWGGVESSVDGRREPPTSGVLTIKSGGLKKGVLPPRFADRQREGTQQF